MRKLLPLALLGLSAFAQVDVPFWHAMDGPAGRLIAAFAQEFNARQDRYRVLPRYQGTYEEAETKLVAALRAGSGPVLFQAELSFFPRLVAEGQALPLEAYLDLDPGFVADLFAPAWNYGVVGEALWPPLQHLHPGPLLQPGRVPGEGPEAPRDWRALKGPPSPSPPAPPRASSSSPTPMPGSLRPW